MTAFGWLTELLELVPEDASVVSAVDAWSRDMDDSGFEIVLTSAGFDVWPNQRFCQLLVDLLCTAAVGHANET